MITIVILAVGAAAAVVAGAAWCAMMLVRLLRGFLNTPEF